MPSAVSSGTAALHLALAALTIGPGDEVIVPSFTWVASANVVLHCGATPVIVDVDRATFNIDPVQMERAITPRTRAIMAVHLFGLCAEVDAIRCVAGDIPVIEDAACAAGAAYNDRPAGSLGALGCFSFHPRKTITTGEGGMVTTSDAALAARVEQLRNHGASLSEEQRHNGPQPWLMPDFDVPGFNYRLSDLQAAMGLVQLSRLDAFLDERRQLAELYTELLGDLDWLRLPSAPSHSRHGWQAFVCLIDEERAPLSRNDLMRHLAGRGISTRPGTHAVHMLGCYRGRYGLRPEDCPAARDCDRLSIALPLYNGLPVDDVAYISDAIREKEVSGTFCAKHPAGRSGKRFLTPFSPRNRKREQAVDD